MKMAERIVWTLLFLCNLFQFSNSSCMMTMPKPGTMQCVYKNVTLPLGHSYIDYTNCVEHSCGSDGSMSVCGIGIYAGVFVPPDGCAILKGEKCAFEFVSARDHTIKCEAHIFG